MKEALKTEKRLYTNAGAAPTMQSCRRGAISSAARLHRYLNASCHSGNVFFCVCVIKLPSTLSAEIFSHVLADSGSSSIFYSLTRLGHSGLLRMFRWRLLITETPPTDAAARTLLTNSCLRLLCESIKDEDTLIQTCHCWCSQQPVSLSQPTLNQTLSLH